MTKNTAELQKIIAEADRAIAAAEEARQRRRQAVEQLRKDSQRSHLDRLYAIGRLVFEIGMDGIDDELLAGIMVASRKRMAKNPEHAATWRDWGKAAIEEHRKPRHLEVQFPDRPDRSASAILREAGLHKSNTVTRDGRRWTVYRGVANLRYLERRLAGTGAVITPVEP